MFCWLIRVLSYKVNVCCVCDPSVCLCVPSLCVVCVDALAMFMFWKVMLSLISVMSPHPCVCFLSVRMVM